MKKINKKKAEFIILLLFALLIISSIAFAIPNSLTLQGKLTNLAGASQQGTFNFTFKIYDAATNGNVLWQLTDYNITTDANGIYDVILSGINLSFADQYYLGITVSADNESSPRINLTSSPYSFRANISEGLNPNASYFVRNLSVAGNLTVGTLLYADSTNNLVGIGTPSSNYLLQVASGTDGRSVNLSNVLYVNGSTNNVGIGLNNPNATFHILGSTSATMGQIGDGTNKPTLHITGGGSGASDIVSMNNIDGARIFTLWGNSQLGIGTKKPGGYLDVSPIGGTIPALLVNQSQSGDLIQAQSSAGTVYFIVKNAGNVGINTTTPAQTLTVQGTLNVTSQPTRSGDLFVDSSGNVGIGTTSPTKKLSINGTIDAVTIDPSASPNPVMNTTGNNLTISSAAGSVIIRLG
ncbi:hypothetical protein HYX08_05655 [Candidatus Woesearchaeota archaeon]|nr:hypothetical protein [Candidatus Woesearchaeota archaeon]